MPWLSTSTTVCLTPGSAKHPVWYLNLDADPGVEVQVFDDAFAARATTASGAEWERLWALMRQIWPAYEGYQTKTDREIPVAIPAPVR
jgi:deazaflavin-dependent oxidoreductase (nitroreductase family)